MPSPPLPAPAAAAAPALTITEPVEAQAEALVEHIEAAMEAFNTAHLGPDNERRIVLAAHDAEQRLIGGLVACTCWDYLYLENLWVEPAQRCHGAGAALLQQLEVVARQRGLRMIQLYTFSFEAPAFYARLGYTLAGSIADAPTGTTNHWFYKLL